MSYLKLSCLLTLILGFAPAKSKAYDMDCAIMLCMAGGFPASTVCAAAYREMIRRITPWPSRPPFGVCTFAQVPASLDGPGGQADLDISTPDYAWLRKTRVLWWYGREHNSDDDHYWSWQLRSCDAENRRCRSISHASYSLTVKSHNLLGGIKPK